MHSLAQILADAREETDKLFSVVREGFLYERPILDRHRLIFYLGHVEAFDWNQLLRCGLADHSFHPTFDRLFEAGIDPEPGKGPSDVPQDWPSVEEVLQYGKCARQRVDRLLAHLPGEIRNMMVEHRLMHAETLAYLLHSLPYSQKCAPAIAFAPLGEWKGGQVLTIPEASTTLGRNRRAGFGWDNEFEEHQVPVGRFLMDRFKVTNQEYLKMVDQGAPPPHFWTERQGKWHLRTMFSVVPLPLDWPVYVTHEEASAYARFVGKKLPTEEQFHRAAYGAHNGPDHLYPWGDSTPASIHGNFGFTGWDPVPVDAYPAGESEYRVAQMVGNGWEWTSTVFSPFPGFEESPTYPGYSANFFDGRHYVLKGASPRTASCFLRRSFRNWFRPNYPYVYATFRCVED